MWDSMQIRWRPDRAPRPTGKGGPASAPEGGPAPDSVGREPEWLVTNGLGGFAAGSVSGLLRRRYHGLLIASLQPPVRRCLLWAKNDEGLATADGLLPLGGDDYGDVVAPDGWRRLHSFRLYPFPTTTFLARGIELERTVFMVHGQNTTVVLYRFLAVRPGVELRVHPFVNCRDYHHTTRAPGGLAAGGMHPWDGGCRIDWGPARPAFVLGAGCEDAGEADGGGPRLRYESRPEWYYNFHYAVERQRGLDWVEDHFRPGVFRWRPRGPGDVLALVGSCPESDGDGGPPWRQGSAAVARWARRAYGEALARRTDRLVRALGAASSGATVPSPPAEGDRGAARRAAAADPVGARLLLAADDFVVRRRTTGAATIVAGYPWFTDWGRDAMISLPGLLLVPGRREEAREVLLTFAAHRAEGLIPNRFPDDGGEPVYNAVDASLWFLWAVGRYAAAVGDDGEVRKELLPVMEDVVRRYVEGTRHGIGVDDEGLVRASAPGLQLTWMDAKAGDWVVTPRAGAAVEVNALWYSGLRTVAALCRRWGGSRAPDYEALARRVRRAFLRRFAHPSGGLRDVAPPAPGRKDFAGPAPGPAGGTVPPREVRPNQMFAASLPFPPLPPTWIRRVVGDVARHLLTPVGLRTLAPDDPAYVGDYGGDQRRRDAAYHQGAVWPWLLGPLADGLRRAAPSSGFDSSETGFPSEGAAGRRLFRALEAHLVGEAGLGHVSEIFTGDAPHGARGCFAQAWSVAEWLRVRRGFAPGGGAETKEG